MTYSEKKQVKSEIIISSFVILIVAAIVVFIENSFPDLIRIFGVESNTLILRTSIPTVGLFLGFIITSYVMKFNQLDSILFKIVEDLNFILFGNNKYRNTYLLQEDITEKFKEHLKHSEDKAREQNIFDNYLEMCRFRIYHKKWMVYPLYYSLITLLVSFLLLVFHQTFSKVEYVYTFSFITCCLMSIWCVYINIVFVVSFFDNPFISGSNRS